MRGSPTRVRRALPSAALVALVAACGGGAGTDPNSTGQLELLAGGGEVVAQLSLAAPASGSFVLHGTLPVPRRLHHPDDELSPFALRGPDGVLCPAQVETVSRYPRGEDGSDVVEILARVQRPEDVDPGERLDFEVVLAEHEPDRHRASSAVRTLMRTPRAVVLRTEDVFGHPYEADLLRDLRDVDPEMRILKEGPVARQVRTHETLVPRVEVPGPLGTLPHMMGVHAYVTTWSREEFFSIDLRVHNGHDGLSGHDPLDDPMGMLYFDGLELAVPPGWTVLQAYRTPSLGAPYTEWERTVLPLVAPLAGTKLHVLPPQAQFHRRLVVVREGAEARALELLREEGLAFCREGQRADGQPYFSWWNPRTARYWAQNLPLPNLDYLENPAESREELRHDFEDLNQALTLGTPGPWPVVSPRLGWAHPFGLNTGGMVSGAEIFFFDGVKTARSASRKGYRTFQMTHRMYCERHRTALYDGDGDAYSLEDWIVQGQNGPYLPTWIFLVPWLSLGDPYGFGSAPTFQVDAVAAQGRQPAYEDALLDFDWIDTAHLIRYTRSAKVLAWLGNDAIAKDDLRLQAELCRATYSLLPQNDQGFAITTGALFDRRYVDDHPRDGFVIDRGEGWILDTVAAAYALGDGDFRRRTLPWFEDVIDLIADGQSECGGTIMSKPNLNHFAGQYRLLQSISETILQNGLWGVLTTALNGVEPEYAATVRGVLRESTYAMISATVWNDVTNTPHFYTALGPYDQEQPPFCGWVPPDGHEGDDGWQTWNVYVFGHLLTGDFRFLDRAQQMAGGTLTPQSIGQDVHAGELETRAGMISFLQLRQELDEGGDVREPFRPVDSGDGGVQRKVE